MTSTRLAWSVVLSVFLIAGCGSDTPAKKRDGAIEDDGAAAGSGGRGGIGGTGGGGIGGVGGTSGAGGAGGLVDPGTPEAGVVDATGDVSTDGQTDGGAPDGGGDAGDAATDGGDAATVCTPGCTAGDKRCTATGVQTCELVGGCPAWGTEVACGTNRTCTGTGAASACTCNAAPAGCTAAGNFCMGTTTRVTCAQDANGCWSITASKTCGMRQTCTGNLPAADCTCAAGPTGCAAAGTFCSATDKFATCAQDTDGCFFQMGAETTCTGGQVCVAAGATASCGCAATGTTAGSGCATVGLTACAGDSVLTCTQLPNSTCRVWTATTDCAATGPGLTCGTKGGGAACQCPAVTNGNFYVDPVAGSDATNAGLFPTGAQAPAGCRLRTLSKATNTVITAGQKIIATTATLPAVFTESASITIPAGVSLTTADTAPTAANYKLMFTGSTGTAVVLSNGSSLTGFTIENGNTGANPANPAAALGCLVGSVTVTSVILNGTSANNLNVMTTGLQIGNMPFNTCTGTFANVTIDGFANGVVMNGSPATAPTLVNSTIINNLAADIGVLVSAGTLESSNLVIQPKIAATAAGHGVVVRPISSTLAHFIGTNPSIQTTAGDALWLDTGSAGASAPRATLTGGAIINATGADSSGIRVEIGTLTITGNLQVTGSDQHGLEVLGGTVTATDLTIAGSTMDGVNVTGGNVTLHKTAVRNSLQRNVFMSAGNVVIDDGSAITGAGSHGVLYASGANSDLTIGAATGTEVDISTNLGHGLNLEGTGGVGSTIAVQRTNLRDNNLNGLKIHLTANGSAVSVASGIISGNHQNGVVVTSAPSANASNMVSLDALEVRLHTGATFGRGIWLNGNEAASNNITATINNCKIHSNRETGLLIDEDMPPAHTTTTRTTLTNNDIYSNYATASAGDLTAVGGISFATSSELTAFTGNKIHGNGGDQMAFRARQTNTLNWDLDPGSCTSTTAPRNQLYCYATGRVGIRTTNTLTANPPDYTVDADRVSWTNAAPEDIAQSAAKRDFSEGADTNITVATPCTAVGANVCP